MYGAVLICLICATNYAGVKARYNYNEDRSPASGSTNASKSGSNFVKVAKCCDLNEVMIDHRCAAIKDTRAIRAWKPQFKNEYGQGLKVDPMYELKIGSPRCKPNEKEWDIYHTPPLHDLLMILPSGKLRHCVRCSLEGFAGDAIGVEDENVDFASAENVYHDYEFGAYCADNIILSNSNASIIYAHVCLPQGRGMHTDFLMRRVIDPAFHALSIVCYLVVAVVYFVLPQLRNLVGNIITSMTLCLIASQCAAMVRIFTEFSSHVSFMIADTVMYVSLLSAFFWLNGLGFYIWKTFRSRNVFLRITDGRKYCYYSCYVWGSTLIMAGMAIFAHFVLDTSKPTSVNSTLYATQETIGWLGIAVFFTPVAFTIFINIWFVLTTSNVIKRMNTYGRIHHKMKYSFRMFILLFAIMSVAWFFMLLSWMRHELVYCYIVINLLHAILILYVCVFGQRRVTFLLRKTCNCCSPGETPEGLDWGEEMTAMNLG